MKKLTALISAFTLAVCAVPMASSAESKEYILTDGTVIHSGDECLAYREAYINDTSSDLGDVDRDGCITRADAVMIAEYVVALAADKYDDYTEEEHEIFRKYGDVFNDGQVNVIDASFVLDKATANAEHIYDVNTEEFDKRWNEFIDSENDGFCDVNHDGFVDARDATIVLDYYAYLSVSESTQKDFVFYNYTEEQTADIYVYGDVNKDGYIDAIDASWIAFKYAENSTQE